MLEPGEDKLLTFDFDGRGELHRAVLAGRLTVNGAPPLGGRVVARGSYPAQAELLGDGRFEIALPNDTPRFTLGAEVKVLGPFTAEPVSLEMDFFQGRAGSPTNAGTPHEPIDHDLDIVFLEVALRRRSGARSGEPVPGLRIGGPIPLTGIESVRTGPDGIARYGIRRPEHSTLRFELDPMEVHPRSHPTELRPGQRSLRVTLECDPVVPCSGTLMGTAPFVEPTGYTTLVVMDDGETAIYTTQIHREATTFVFPVLPARALPAQLGASGARRMGVAHFELPEGGSEAIELRFQVE